MSATVRRPIRIAVMLFAAGMILTSCPANDEWINAPRYEVVNTR